MKQVSILKIEALGSYTEKHWVCIECTPKLLKRLSVQVGQLNKIIKKLSTGVDN